VTELVDGPTERASLERARLRALLVDAAGHSEADGRPFADLSVGALVATAGISRSSFYKYFHDKQGFLLAVADDVEEQFLAAARAWLDLPAAATREEYAEAFGAIFAAYRQRATAIRLVTDAAAYDDAVAERFGRMMDRFVDAIAHHVAVATHASEELSRDLATWITWMLELGQAHLIADAAPDEQAVHAETVATLTWKMLHQEPGA